jgi:fructose-1,6-bisphosphatase/inositol monophosphatase family enzyme
MFHSIRVLGSAALALCYVAMGIAEAYHIDGLQCWDVAAGALIVKEAGGTVLDSTGTFNRFLFISAITIKYVRTTITNRT